MVSAIYGAHLTYGLLLLSIAAILKHIYDYYMYYNRAVQPIL